MESDLDLSCTLAEFDEQQKSLNEKPCEDTHSRFIMRRSTDSGLSLSEYSDETFRAQVGRLANPSTVPYTGLTMVLLLLLLFLSLALLFLPNENQF